MNFYPRHGTVLPITAAEATRLASHWLAPADVLATAQNPALRPHNTLVDSTASKVVYLGQRLPGWC